MSGLVCQFYMEEQFKEIEMLLGTLQYSGIISAVLSFTPALQEHK